MKVVKSSSITTISSVAVYWIYCIAKFTLYILSNVVEYRFDLRVRLPVSGQAHGFTFIHICTETEKFCDRSVESAKCVWQIHVGKFLKRSLLIGLIERG